MTFTLDRTKTILFIVSMNAYMNESAGNTGNSFAFIDIDGVEYFVNRMVWASGSDMITNGSTFVIKTDLAAGSHTVKLVGHHDIISGSTSKFVIYSYNFAYNQLGT